MRELNSKIFYKAMFTLKSEDASDDLLWKLVMEIRNWLTKKYNRKGNDIIEWNKEKWTSFKFGSKLRDIERNNLFFAQSCYHVNHQTPNDIYWACEIKESPSQQNGNIAPREWLTEIGYHSKMAGTAEIFYIVSYSDLPGFIGELDQPPVITLPNVIRRLICSPDFKCKIGDKELSVDPIKLDCGDYPALHEVLFNPRRELPVIYISPIKSSSGNEITTLISPQKLAESVAANALVYYSEDLDFSEEMNYLCEPNYLCHSGAIRIYQPNIQIDKEEDSRRHRYILSDYISEKGEDEILLMLRRALAQDVHFYERPFLFDDCQKLKDMDIIRKNFKKQKDADIDAFADDLEGLESESNRLKNEIQNKNIENENLKHTISSLRLYNNNLEEKTQDYDQLENACDQIRDFPKYPATPFDVAHYFEQVYPDRIAFTEKAYHSLLEDCITKPEILWSAFYNMATKLVDLFKENPSQAYKNFSDETGWECARGLGSNTRANKNLMRNYIDSYDGQEINIEAHLKSGNKDTDSKSVRIYFAIVNDKVIIGHCGKHLDNATTQKVK